MYIKQSEMFKLESNAFYPLSTKFQDNISYIVIFFHDAFGRVMRKGIESFLNSLYVESGECGISFEMVDLNIDTQTNLVYLGETFEDYIRKATTSELYKIYNSTPELELCKRGLINYALMTKENFIHLIKTWDKYWQNESPFILLYQDDKDGYDILPFDTQEAMEQFIANNTKQETIQS